MKNMMKNVITGISLCQILSESWVLSEGSCLQVGVWKHIVLSLRSREHFNNFCVCLRCVHVVDRVV